MELVPSAIRICSRDRKEGSCGHLFALSVGNFLAICPEGACKAESNPPGSISGDYGMGGRTTGSHLGSLHPENGPNGRSVSSNSSD